MKILRKSAITTHVIESFVFKSYEQPYFLLSNANAKSKGDLVHLLGKQKIRQNLGGRYFTQGKEMQVFLDAKLTKPFLGNSDSESYRGDLFWLALFGFDPLLYILAPDGYKGPYAHYSEKYDLGIILRAKDPQNVLFKFFEGKYHLACGPTIENLEFLETLSEGCKIEEIPSKLRKYRASFKKGGLSTRLGGRVHVILGQYDKVRYKRKDLFIKDKGVTGIALLEGNNAVIKHFYQVQVPKYNVKSCFLYNAKTEIYQYTYYKSKRLHKLISIREKRFPKLKNVGVFLA